MDGPEPARRSQCANNLKQIGLALHDYHRQYGSFPPAYVADEKGQPIHSWRVLILPFLDADGAVSFMAETISPEELRALLTIAGGEEIGDGVHR